MVFELDYNKSLNQEDNHKNINQNKKKHKSYTEALIDDKK